MPDLKKRERVYFKRRTIRFRKFNIKSLKLSQKLDYIKYSPFTIEAKLENNNYRLRLLS